MRYLLIALVLISIQVSAKNIDLSTVPSRDTVQLTIYNAEDITLVRETRQISFKEGINPLQFSWANTLIDPSSVQLRFVNHAAELELLETRFPHDKPQMLYWLVASEFDGAVTVEITYFTSGISWKADYTAIANQDETKLMLESFVKVINNSGEDYENAQVRLVVGTINLVERIANLAQGFGQYVHRDEVSTGRYQATAKEEMMYYDMPSSSTAYAAPAPVLQAPKEVVKESLSEYFIYTIEGTETIPHGWSKRLLSFRAKEVPFDIEYRFRPAEYGNQLVRLYLMQNDKESKLGTTPLPEGPIRLFKQNQSAGLSYVGQQNLKYVPIGDKIELNLGADPNVRFDLIKTKVLRDNILMKEGNKNVYRPLLDPYNVTISYNNRVAGWNDNVFYQQRIRNYTDKPIKVEVRRSFDGDVIFVSDFADTLYDYRTVEYTAEVAAGEKKALEYTVITRQGKNAKKNNVELE